MKLYSEHEKIAKATLIVMISVVRVLFLLKVPSLKYS
jgi:hypothetical protein